MAARKKPAKRKVPKRKAPKRKSAKRKAAKPKAAPRRSARRTLPNDDAWRELVETAIETPDPDGSAASRRKSK